MPPNAFLDQPSVRLAVSPERTVEPSRVLPGTEAGTRESPESDRFRHVLFSGRPVRRAPLRIPPALRGVGVGAAGTERGGDADLDPNVVRFLRGLLDRTGLHGERYRGGPLARRYPAVLRHLRAATLEEADARLARDPALVERILEVLLLGVTEVFRDPPLFDQIRDEVLPKMVAHGRPPRIWSVGCSDGSELVSVALLLEEAGGFEGAELLGTDCRPGAIRQAERGWYSRESLRRVPGCMLDRHFVERRGGYELRQRLRRRLAWRMADALDRTEPGPWDLILCRNVAMYLNPSTAEALWKSLIASLVPGGWLITGRAERRSDPGIEAVRPSIHRRGGTNGT